MVNEKYYSRPLYTLTFAEFWDRFTYYGIQALLVLYVTKFFLLTDKQAYEVYGAFTALTFATPVLGGMLADKIAGTFPCIVGGASLIIMGNIFLSLPSQTCLYIGLSFLICGIGLFKSNNATLVGTLHKETSLQQRAFSIFYMGMNAGALLGPILYGYLAHCCGWYGGFGISAMGVITALFLLLRIKMNLPVEAIFSLDKFRPSLFLNLKTKFVIMGGVIGIISLIYVLLRHAEYFGKLLFFVGIAAIIGLGSFVIRSNPVDRKKVIGLCFLAFFCIFFFAASLQTATTLTLFIERDVNRTIGNIHIPTMMFLSLEPFFIILCAPWFNHLWRLVKEPDFSTKIAIGLLLACVSFLIFSLAAHYTHMQGHIALFFVILGNLLLGLGELCVLPVALSAISSLSPPHIRSTMIGILFLSLAFSGYLAGAMANFISIHNLTINLGLIVNYTQAFMEVAFITFIVAIFVFLMSPLLKRMLLPMPSRPPTSH